MTTSKPPPLSPQNQDSLNTLMRSLERSQGMFSLILVRCNYRRIRERILATLKPRLSFLLREICLTPQTKTLFTAIQQTLGTEKPTALMVYGLETVTNLSELLRVANQSREEFRNHLACPLAIWITDDILRRLIREATDFESWASVTIAFENDVEELSQLILETADILFAQLLNSRENVFLNNQDLHLEEQSPLRLELRAACQELHRRLDPLPTELAANGQFILGRVADNNGEAAREHYEQSLELWRQTGNLERYAHVQFYLGFWWGNYAVRHLSDRPHGLRQARVYLEASMTTFKQIGHDHRIAQFINFLGEVLHCQQDWQTLGRLAYDAFLLHQRHCNYFRQAKALGLMAEVAIAKPHWSQAEHLANRALATWEQATKTLPNHPDRQAFLIWERSFHCPWYLYSLGKAKRHMSQLEEAAQHLEEARKIARPSYDPDLYTKILNELREIYFTQKRYLAAYRTRQARRDIQSKFNLRAFTGPGRLQASQEITNPALPTPESRDQIAPEIWASGRQQAIADLLQRIERKDYRLTVIYGPSGVGKSSILQAGLIPALKQQTFDGRKVIPVLQQIYTDWLENLNTQLQSACQEAGINRSASVLASADAVLQQLQTNSYSNFKTILIFDQFEEFFFANPNVHHRRSFYELAVQCFKILDVDIILAMREDYLHYLLVCNRLSGLDIISNNILDKSVLYEIGNFTSK
ncbi:MAG: sugar-binding protein, partial [Cyanobacteria bacterium J06559_3]